MQKHAFILDSSVEKQKNMEIFFASLKKLKKHVFILFSSVEKLKKYGNIFCQPKKYGDKFCKLTKYRFDFFYMLEKAQKYEFGNYKISKNMIILFVELKDA